MSIFSRKKKVPPSLSDEALARMWLVQERSSIRDNELKLIRTVLSTQRKEVLANKNLGKYERRRMLGILDAISKQGLEVAFLMNRKRMQQMGAPKKQVKGLHGVKIT